jgi:hypothetical protein
MCVEEEERIKAENFNFAHAIIGGPKLKKKIKTTLKIKIR